MMVKKRVRDIFNKIHVRIACKQVAAIKSNNDSFVKLYCTINRCKFSLIFLSKPTKP